MITTIALLSLCLVLLLALPVEIIFVLQHEEASRRDVSLVCFFGLIRISLRSRSRKQTREKPFRKKPKKTKRSGQRKVLSLVRNAYFRQRVLRYARYLFRSINVRTLDLQVRLGLDDPADTGRLWGVMGPLSALLACCRHAKIRIEPDFAEEICFWESHGRIRVRPLQVILISLSFFLSPQVMYVLASNR